MNISVYQMLRSCGVQAGGYPKTEVKMKLILLASEEWSWLRNLGFHFPKLDYPQCLKVHILPFGKSIYLEEFNMVVYYQTVCYSRKKLSRGLGSPGSRQLLRPQLFFPNFLNFGPLTTTFWPKIRQPSCHIFDTSLSHVWHFGFFWSVENLSSVKRHLSNRRLSDT